jgi:hypothetical protein
MRGIYQLQALGSLYWIGSQKQNVCIVQRERLLPLTPALVERGMGCLIVTGVINVVEPSPCMWSTVTCNPKVPGLQSVRL